MIENREPSSALAQHVASYQPRHVPSSTWACAAAEVRIAALRSASTVPRVRVVLPSLAAFAEWLVREGIAVDVDSLADALLIERYVQVGMRGKAPATRATRRSTLRQIAARIDPGFGPPPERIGYRRARAPYRSGKLRSSWSWPRHNRQRRGGAHARRSYPSAWDADSTDRTWPGSAAWT
jgi:hypothetical protein